MLNFSLEMSYNIKVYRDLLEWTLYENVSTCTIRLEQVLKIEYKESICYRSKNGLHVGILKE